MKTKRRLEYCLLFALGLGACGSTEEQSSVSGGAEMDASTDSAPMLHALHIQLALKDDGQGVKIGAQNGASVYILPSLLIGKPVVWATAPGGEPIFNVMPIEFGTTVLGQNLDAEFQSSAQYADGPWEMALFISLAGASPFAGPQPGDLAAFDNSAPPEGQAPVTGVSVRMTVMGGDAKASLGNEHFIQY